MSNCRRTVNHVFLFFFCIVLSACTGLATAQPFAQTPQITQQFTTEIKAPTKAPATLETSPIFTSTVKPTGTSTSLPHPSDMPTVSERTNTPTVTTQAMLTEQALALKETQIASFPTKCSKAYRYTNSLSPNGNWLVLRCVDKQDQTLEIINKEGKQYELIFKDYQAFTTSGGGDIREVELLSPAHWTSDEQYLFFVSIAGFDGGGTCFYGFGIQGLYRINLNTGIVSTVLTPEWDGYEIAFSPNGKELAYKAGHPIILDLRTGEEIVFYAGDREIGDLNWSPDSSELAYSTCKRTQDGMGFEKSSVQLYSLDKQSWRTILEVDSGFLRIDISDGNKLLKIYNASTDHPDYLYFFDWSTEQLITSTLTPTP